MADGTIAERLRALRCANADEVARLTKAIVDAAEALDALERRMEAEARAIAGKGFETEFKSVSFQGESMHEQWAWYWAVESLRFGEVANFMDKVYRAAKMAAKTEGQGRGQGGGQDRGQGRGQDGGQGRGQGARALHSSAVRS